MRHETKPQLTVCPPPTGMAECLTVGPESRTMPSPVCCAMDGIRLIADQLTSSRPRQHQRYHQRHHLNTISPLPSLHHHPMSATPAPINHNQPSNLFLPIREPKQGPSQDLCGSRTPAPKVAAPKQNNKRVNLINNLGKIIPIGIGKTAFARLSCILTFRSGRRGKIVPWCRHALS